MALKNGTFPDVLKTVGARVKARRAQLAFSKLELASRTGFTVEQISKIEAGKIDLSFRSILSLAKALEISQENCLLRRFQ